MGVRAGVVFLFVLSACCASGARELVISDFSGVETVNSDISGSKIYDKNEGVCTMCEEYASKTLGYLAENETQTEVMDVLHNACSRLFFKQECVNLVDYYAPLFFSKISSLQPQDICQKLIICEKMVLVSEASSPDSCELCHRAVVHLLLKLKDPDTQLEIIELLLKECDAAENYVKKCKRLVFEYGPLILANAEQFLETSDICTKLHACHLPPTAGDKQASNLDGNPMFSDS